MHASRNPSAPLDGTASRVDSSVPVANRRGRGGSGTPGPSPVARGSATRRDVMNGGGSGGGRRGDRHGHRTSGDAPHKENSRRSSNNSSPVSGAAPSGGRNVASLALDVLEQELTSDTPPPMATATASPSPSLEYCQQQQQQPPSLPSPGNRVREHAPRRSSTSGNVPNHPSTTCIDSPSEYVSLPSLPTVTSTPVKKPTQSRRPSSTSDVPSPLGARKTTKNAKAPGEAGGGGKGSSSGTGVSATPQHPTRNGSNGSRNAPAMSTSLPSSPRRNSSTGPLLLSPLPLAGPTDTTALTPQQQQQQPSVAPVPSPHAQVVNQLFKSVAGTKPQEALPLIIEQLKSQQQQQQQQQQQHTPTRGDTGDHPAPVTTARKSAATTATARIPPAPPPPLTHSKANQQQPSTTTTANSSPSTTPRQLVPPPPPPPSASSTTTARQQDQQRVSSSSLSGTSRSQRSSTSRSSSSLIPASGNGNTTTTTTTTTPHAPTTAIPWSSPSCNQTLNSMSIDEDALLSPLPTATGMPSAFLLHEATPLGSGQYGVPRNNSTTTLASGAPSPSTSSLQGAVATSAGGVTAAGYMYPSVFASRSGRVSPQNTPHMRNGLVPTFTTTNTVNNAVGSCQTLPLEECSRSDVSSMFSINSVDLQEFIYEFRMAKEAVVNGAAAGIGALDSTSREGPGGDYPRGQDAGHRNSGGGGDDEGAAHRIGAAADGSSWGESHPHQHSNAAEQRKRESMADSTHNNSSGRDEITIEELALILDRVAFPVLDMALLSDLFDELSDSAAAANGVTGFQGSSCGAVPAAMVGGSVNSTGNSSAFFSPSVRNSLVAAAVSRSASATLLNSQHCSPGAQSLPRTSPANNALAGYGGANHSNTTNTNNGSVGNTSAASGYASLPSATSRRSGGAPRLVGHNGAGGDGNAFSYAHPQGSSSGYGLPSALPIPDVAAAPSHAPPARSSGIVGKSSKRSSVDTAVAAAPVGIAAAGHVHDSINGDRNNNGRDGPAPTVDFEVFLARMAFKIQGRYPTEVVRSAFFRTVDTLARQRHQRSPPPHSSDTPDTADTISCTSIFTDGGANAWASHTTTAAGGEREDSGCCSTSTDTDADNSAVPLSPCGNTEGCCPADASDTATCAPTPTQRSRSRNDTSTASGAHGASGCGSRRGESPTTNTLHSVSASSDLACHSELPPPPPMQQPHGSGEREDEEDRHRPRGGMAPSGASTDSLAMAAAAVFGNGDKEHLAFERTVTDDAGGEEEREEDGLDPSPPLLDTVTLRDCLTLGIQRYLGFRDFNGVDAQQALRRSGFPDNNLNITLHMNDFIRLVHALAAVVYGGCGGGGGGSLSGTVSVPGGSSPATGSMLLSTPAATGYQLRRSSSHRLLGSPRPPDGHVMSTAAKRAFM